MNEVTPVMHGIPLCNKAPRRWLLGIISLCWAALGMAKDPFAYGLVAYHIPLPGYQLNDDDFARMAANGINWVEMDYAWNLIEPQPGVFDFSYYDKITKAARANGLHILAKLGNGYNGSRPTAPNWTYTLTPDAYLAAITAYARAVIVRYGDQIDGYALENEANIAAIHSLLGWRVGQWPQDRIVAIWKTLGDAVRLLDPDATIALSLSATFFEQWTLSGWFAAARSAGVPYDMVGLQTYLCRFMRQPRCFDATAEQIRRVSALAGKPVVVLETGYTSADPGATEDKQARFIEGIVPAIREAGATGVFIYEYLENPNEPDATERGFGLVHPDRSPKPAWQSYGDVIRATTTP